MKNKFTKLVSLFMSAVMTVSALSLSGFSSFAETGDSPEQTVDTQDKEIEYGGIFGSMLSDEIDESVQEKEEAANRDYTVYKVYHDPASTCVGVDYKAKTECTLFIGFYNDEGTELITSATNDLEPSENGYAETYTNVSLPDHYLIKCFIVGKEIRNPLSKPCIYNKCTKQMQEILAKTTNDYEEEQVVNLDDNKSNNFLVLQEGVIDITPTESTDIYKGEDDNGNYIFENAVEIAKLKKGDKVFVRSKPEMVAFIVDNIETEENQTIISRQKSELNDFIQFVKFNSDEYTGEVYSGTQENESENAERAPLPQELAPQTESDDPFSLQLPTIESTFDLQSQDDFTYTEIYEFSATEKLFPIKNPIDAKGYGSITSIISGHYEIYFEPHIFEANYLSIDFQFTLEVKFTIGLKVTKNFYLMGPTGVPVFSVGILTLLFKPSISISADGKAYIDVKKDFYTTFDTTNGLNFSSSEPVVEEIDGLVQIDILLNFELNFEVTAVTVLTITPSVGFRFKIHDTETAYSSKEKDYIHHDCKSCITVDVSFIFQISEKVGMELFNISGLGISYTFTSTPIDIPLLSFHNNEDGFGWGKCDNYSYKVGFTVKSYKNNKPISDVKFYVSTPNEGVQTIKDYSGDDKTTNTDGKAEFWLQGKLLSQPDCRIKAVARSGEFAVYNIGRIFDKNSEGKYNSMLKIDLDSEHVTSSTDDPDKDKDKEGNKEGSAKEEQKEITPKHIVCGYAVDDKGEFIEDQNGNAIPSVFCTIYPDENSTDPTHPYQDVGYISGKGVISGVRDIPEIVKKIVVIDPETKLWSSSFGNAHFESIDISAMEIHDLPDTTFHECKNLKEVKLPANLLSIGDYALADCPNLKHIDLPDTVVFIGPNAFKSTGLTELTCPRELITIANSAFENCTDLREIKFNSKLEHIGIGAFIKNAFEIIEIPASVNEIGYNVFTDCLNLKTLIINSDFDVPSDSYYNGYLYSGKKDEEHWSDNIFDYYGQLSQVIFNEGVTRINTRMLANSPNVRYVKLPSTLKKIEDGAFSGTNISEIELPEGVQYIDHNALNTAALKSITINSSDCYCAVHENQEPAMIKSGKEIIIYGHTGSTAESFAKENGNTFISLDQPQTTKPAATTTTKTTTVTTTATTTVTTVVSTIIGPDKECLFIAVKDPATATEAGSDRLLDVDNVAYIDQQTADEKGKVTFSFIPDAVKDLAYLFISEINYSKINKTVVNGTDVQTTWYPATDPSVTVYGDSNNDGVVELADAILIMQQMANPDKYALNGSSQYCITEQGMINGDVYEPGSGLTGNDALTIQEYLLGKRDNLVRY